MADEQAIRAVITEQFSTEISRKEEEMQKIDDRIQLAKMMLQRLRLGILAQQYGVSGFYLMDDYSKENVGLQTSWDKFEKEFLVLQEQPKVDEVNVEDDEKGEAEGKDEVKGEVDVKEEEGEGSLAVGLGRLVRDGKLVERSEEPSSECGDGAVSYQSSAVSSQAPSEAGDDDSDIALPSLTPYLKRRESSLLNSLRVEAQKLNGKDLERATAAAGSLHAEAPLKPERLIKDGVVSSPQLPASLSRYCTKKRIIVGNTSQFLEPSARGSVDASTHKWMVYVRGPSVEPDISSFVKAVRFFLHPSYHPNDIIRICKAPFQLTRYGWGEFPVRVQLEFSDKRNKHVDIIHNLVLDRTHTGHQTLGAETVVNLDLLFSESLHQHHHHNRHRHGDTGVLKNNSIHPYTPTGDLRHKTTDHARTTDSYLDSNSMHPTVVESPRICHIFIPTSSTTEQVLLDHSYSQIVVVSHRSSVVPSTKEEEAMDTEAARTEQNAQERHRTTIDNYLHSMVKTTPICGPESNGFHLVAPSIESFKKWNIGRRRAAEWMRAVALKRLVQNEKPLPNCSSLTTKQVVDWCRKNGYTPLDPATPTGPGFCKYCGCQLSAVWEGEEGEENEINCHGHCSELMEAEKWRGRVGREGSERRRERDEEEGRDSDDEDRSGEEEDMEEDLLSRPTSTVHPTQTNRVFSTISAPFGLFESVISRDKELRRQQERRDREQAVDVVSVPAHHRKPTEPVPRFRVPHTPELKWVQQTAAAIGIPIFPAVIDRMYAHVVEHMIYMACTKFARALIVQAVSESARQVEEDSSEERTLVPLHIYRAIQSLETCDFLTNACLGLPTASTAGRDDEEIP